MNFTISHYQPEDFSAIISLLQESLPAESVSGASFARRVFLDPNLRPEGRFVAKNETGAICGFLLSILPLNLIEVPESDKGGWITLFAVAADCRKFGLGSKLFEVAESWLKSNGASSVLISCYPQGYWTPGVDESLYPEALRFLSNRDYEVISRPLSMSVALDADWQIPEWALVKMGKAEKSGIRIEPFSPGRVPALLDFLNREFPGDWERHLKETLNDILRGYRSYDEVQALFDGSDLIGFAQSEGERFGPFGVAQSQRGKGMGAILMFRTLLEMKSRGHSRAWFMWTNDSTAQRLYSPAGFKETRRFSVFKKTL